jgi:hypothetical protein
MCASVAVIGMPLLFWKFTMLGLGFALWILAFPLLSLLLRREDLALDKAAVALTGDPISYLSAIERAARFTPSKQRFPWWFRPVSLQARQEAIRRQASRDLQVIQPA